MSSYPIGFVGRTTEAAKAVGEHPPGTVMQVVHCRDERAASTAVVAATYDPQREYALWDDDVYCVLDGELEAVAEPTAHAEGSRPLQDYEVARIWDAFVRLSETKYAGEVGTAALTAVINAYRKLTNVRI